jgi:hypothetical protein
LLKQALSHNFASAIPFPGGQFSDMGAILARGNSHLYVTQRPTRVMGGASGQWVVSVNSFVDVEQRKFVLTLLASVDSAAGCATELRERLPNELRCWLLTQLA